MPEITVIVPVYKAENYLRACVDSILSQTFSDFEIILVDDGSPDGCGAICDSYARQDPRVRVIHQKNQGQSAARNHALAQAKGTWICFVDSDDLIHPQQLQRLYEAAISNDAGISMCTAVEGSVLPENFLQEPDDAVEVLPMNEQTLIRLYDKDEYPSWVVWGKLIRKEYIEKHIFCQGKIYEDNEAVCHWMYQTQKLVRLKAPMYFYRTTPGSTTQQGFTVKKLDYMWALENIIRFYDSVGYAQMKNRFARLYTGEVINCCNGLRYSLKEPARIGTLVKNARRFCREQDICFSDGEKDQLFEAMHPQWMRLYWPLIGAIRTLRTEGVSGLMKKIRKNLGKEVDQ